MEIRGEVLLEKEDLRSSAFLFPFFFFLKRQMNFGPVCVYVHNCL